MLNRLKEHYRDAKAELAGVGRSRARRIKTLDEIDASIRRSAPRGPARPTNVVIRMLDGRPMRYFTDGSLRHATGAKPGKAARKVLKQARRAA